MKTKYNTFRAFATLLCALAALLLSSITRAQNVALSTNLASIADFGTLNMEASYAVSQHWSLTAGMRYNPFTFNGGADDGERQNRQRSVSAGARYWPWHIYSGWWAAAKAQWQEYNLGGFSSPQTREGDRLGAGVSLGYSYMLSPHINMEMGAGIWGGAEKYTLYACPTCGRRLDNGNAMFVMLNEVLVSLSYVF